MEENKERERERNGGELLIKTPKWGKNSIENNKNQNNNNNNNNNKFKIKIDLSKYIPTYLPS